MEGRDRYEGDFLTGSDLPEGKLVTVTIDNVTAPGTEKDATGKTIEHGIIGFRKAHKRLILNKTNRKLIATQLGPKADAWPGKEIALQRRYLKEFMGHQNVICIRVIVDPKKHGFPMAAHKFMGSPTPIGS